MDAEQVLSIYEDISRVTRQMLAAARSDDWDRLISLERDCNTQFAQLYTHRDSGSPNPDFERRKAELIRSVLEDDAQIRLLVEPWLANLGALMGTTRQKQRLSTTYQNGD